MARYAALLRGINVGGHNKIAMADLRALLAATGYTDVATYLQSGNAVFTARNAPPDEIAAEVEAAVTRGLGLGVAVLVRTSEELDAVVAANPFPDAVDPKKLNVAFLGAEPVAAWQADRDPARYAPDRFELLGRELYVWYADSVLRTTLTRDFWKGLPGTVTARNWNTVTRVRALAHG